MIQSNSTRLSRRVDAYARFTSDAVGASPHFGPLFVTLDARRRELALAADAYRGPVRNPTGAPPVLIVGATGDDETPYAEAVALQSQLGNVGLLTLDGIEHGSYLASACVRRHVDAYLASGTLPPPGTVCR